MKFSWGLIRSQMAQESRILGNSSSLAESTTPNYLVFAWTHIIPRKQFTSEKPKDILTVWSQLASRSSCWKSSQSFSISNPCPFLSALPLSIPYMHTGSLRAECLVFTMSLFLTTHHSLNKPQLYGLTLYDSIKCINYCLKFIANVNATDIHRMKIWTVSMALKALHSIIHLYLWPAFNHSLASLWQVCCSSVGQY